MNTESKKEISKTACTYVINLVASVINNAQPPENTENVPWDDIIDFARAQSVLNIVAYAVEKLDNKPDEDIVKMLHNYKRQKILVEAEQEIEASDALDKLESMGIRHMPLKGYLIKNIYPSPDMRTMGDIDILVEPSRCKEVADEFVKNGFTFAGEGDLHTNVERGNAYFEFHRSMVNERYESMSAYFSDGFSLAHRCEGFSYRYELSKETFYIFLIAHLAKHYRYGGTGIRTLLDLYVYRRTYPELDLDYVSRELSKIGIEKFRQNMETIADRWFSGSFDGEYDTISSYIIAGGVYGVENARMINDFAQRENKEHSLFVSKIKRILRLIFPPFEIMSVRYPVLKKHKWLLPVYWIIRVPDTIIHSPETFRDRINDSVVIAKTDSSMIDAQKNSGIEKM